MNSNAFVADLNLRYFNNKLSSDFQNKLCHLPVDRPDVLAFVERMFGYTQASGLPAQDLSLLHADIMGSLLARILPGAWGGRVPPITVQGRHAAIDRYVLNNGWLTSTGNRLLDIGCGFPPFTTIETADSLKSWEVTGADPSLPAYLVYDADGNYASFDRNKEIVYFQPAVPSVENWNNLLQDAPATRALFTKSLELLLKKPAGSGLPRVEQNPIKQYETERLRFLQGGIGEVDIPPQDVIRCFNVMYYFDAAFQQKALQWFATSTTEGGILLMGGDWAVSTECYYHVYKKENNQLVKKEFAFSIDCLTPIGIASWFSNHDDEPQKAELMNYLSILRRDQSFIAAYYACNDAERARYNICPRNTSGYYTDVDATAAPAQLWTNVGKIMGALEKAGLNEQAAAVLKRAGYNASVNEVNHISIHY